MALWLSLVFQVRNFGQTTAMTLGTAEPRVQKGLNNSQASA